MIDEPRNLTDEPAADLSAQPAPVGRDATVDHSQQHESEQPDAQGGFPEAQNQETQPEDAVNQASAEEQLSDQVAEQEEPAAEAETVPLPEESASAVPPAVTEQVETAADTDEVEAGEGAIAEDEADELVEADDDDTASGLVEEIEEEIEEQRESVEMDWYILKVQSNRERSIAEALQRKIAIEGLDRFFGQVIVPTEKVTEFKGGKKKIVERKLWPGYIVVNMHINDDTWFAVRETSGIGDFTGAAGKPTPMQPHEVAKIVQKEDEESEEAPKLAIKFKSGDKVKVKEGNFENFEGEVGSIDEASGRVTVMINIFGRSTPVELEYWQIESM